MKLLEAIQGSIESAHMALRMKQRVTYHPHGADDAPPPTPIEDVLIGASLLNPKELKRWLRRANSENHGRWVLSQVFPRSENPQDYHSRHGMVDPRDHPAQVLGWEDAERLIQEGVREGLDEASVRGGFWREAQDRGIDPEEHFWQNPPGMDDNSKLIGE